MREIKYRAWIKKEKRMDEVNFINFAAQFAGKWECKKPHADLFSDHKDEVATRRAKSYNLEDVELMQWTGIKDKNGIELYEEDICEYHNGRGVYVGVVKYIQEYSAFRLVFNDGTWTDLAFVEVIGNIFENPELLEQAE